MAEQAILTVIANPSSGSQELAAMIEGLVSSTGLGYQVRKLTGINPMEFHRACACDDAIVLDATIEPDGRHNYGTTFPTHHDHVLVVGRSYLPVNYSGTREGGAPKYPHSQSNEAILRWLEPNLRDLKIHPRSHKPSQNAWMITRMWHFTAEQRRGIQLKRKRRAAQSWTFVSYRSGVHQEIASLQSRVNRGELDGLPADCRIFYFQPGELAYERELLSPVRRWQIMAHIDDYVIAAKAFLIYATPDYLFSWWTQGEISALLQGFDHLQVEAIWLLDPRVNRAKVLTKASLPMMLDEWRRRRARWTANSHPDMMSPHSRRIAEIYRELPLIGQIPYVNDEVWGEAFQDHLLVCCEACRRRTLKDDLTWTAEALEQGLSRLDLKQFVFDHREPWFFAVPPDEVQLALARDKPLPCPINGCGASILLEKAPPRYAYDFLPRETAIGPAGGQLIEWPVYCWLDPEAVPAS